MTSHNSTINLCTTSMAAESFLKPKKYIAGISDLAALARQLIWKGILIYCRYIGPSCNRSAVELLKIFTTSSHSAHDPFFILSMSLKHVWVYLVEWAGVWCQYVCRSPSTGCPGSPLFPAAPTSISLSPSLGLLHSAHNLMHLICQVTAINKQKGTSDQEENTTA